MEFVPIIVSVVVGLGRPPRSGQSLGGNEVFMQDGEFISKAPTPPYRVLRNPPTVFIHPNISSTCLRTPPLPICPVVNYTISFSTVSLSLLLSLLLSASRRARNVANWGPFCAIPKGFLA